MARCFVDLVFASDNGLISKTRTVHEKHNLGGIRETLSEQGAHCGPASSSIQPRLIPPPTVAAIVLVRPWRGIFELTLDPRWERFASKGQL